MSSAATFLFDIQVQKQKRVAALYQTQSLVEWQQQAATIAQSQQKSFYQALMKPGLNIIAEIKKASPARGLLRPDFEPVAIAEGFAKAGAAAISVLTEEDYFLGAPAYLAAVRQAVSLPLIMKDFIFDPVQLYQARILGADAVLLIKAILPLELCQSLLTLAAQLHLAVLLEIHSEAELEEVKALKGEFLLGINNRNLETFNMDMTTAPRLLAQAKKHFAVKQGFVAESGYSTAAQLQELAGQGFNAVLIGSAFAQNSDLFRGLPKNGLSSRT